MDPSEISLSLFISFYVTSCCPLELIGLDQNPNNSINILPIIYYQKYKTVRN